MRYDKKDLVRAIDECINFRDSNTGSMEEEIRTGFTTAFVSEKVATITFGETQYRIPVSGLEEFRKRVKGMATRDTHRYPPTYRRYRLGELSDADTRAAEKGVTIHADPIHDIVTVAKDVLAKAKANEGEINRIELKELKEKYGKHLRTAIDFLHDEGFVGRPRKYNRAYSLPLKQTPNGHVLGQ